MPVIGRAGRSMVQLIVDERRCRVCKTCLAKVVCRGSALRVIDPGDSPFLDMSRCWGCLDCIPACPFEAVLRRDDWRAAGEVP